MNRTFLERDVPDTYEDWVMKDKVFNVGIVFDELRKYGVSTINPSVFEVQSTIPVFDCFELTDLIEGNVHKLIENAVRGIRYFRETPYDDTDRHLLIDGLIGRRMRAPIISESEWENRPKTELCFTDRDIHQRYMSRLIGRTELILR